LGTSIEIEVTDGRIAIVEVGGAVEEHTAVGAVRDVSADDLELAIEIEIGRRRVVTRHVRVGRPTTGAYAFAMPLQLAGGAIDDGIPHEDFGPTVPVEVGDGRGGLTADVRRV